MAEIEKDTSLGLRLSSQVIAKQLSIDEALLSAYSGHAVEDFVAGLNIFAGGEYFHLTEMQTRLQSGDAQRAVEGQIPLLELPRELQEQGLVASPLDWEKVESFLKEVEERITELQDQIGDELRRISLIRTAQKNKPSPPKPWLGSTLIFGMTVLFCSFALFAANSIPITLIAFLLGTSLAGILFLKEMTSYGEFIKRVESEARAQKEKLNALESTIKGVQDEIEAVRGQGETRLDKLKIFNEEEKKRIRAAHPLVFPPDQATSSASR